MILDLTSGLRGDEKTDIGLVVNNSQLKLIHQMVQGGVKQGTELVTGGEIATDDTESA